MYRAVVAILAAAVCGCSAAPEPDAGQQPGPEADAPGLLVAMDSAAEAFRAGDYENARRLYELATNADSTLAAPWFGLFMAQRALGNGAQADSALERARRLTVATDPQPGARERGQQP